MPRKSTKQEQYDIVTEPQDDEEEPPAESNGRQKTLRSKVDKKATVKRPQAPVRKAAEPEPEPVEVNVAEVSDMTESGSESEEPLPPKRGKAKPKPKPKQLPAPKTRQPSLWMAVLKENGFMVKGGEFKPTPKKGSPEYEKVRKIFDERKAALSASNKADAVEKKE